MCRHMDGVEDKEEFGEWAHLAKIKKWKLLLEVTNGCWFRDCKILENSTKM